MKNHSIKVSLAGNPNTGKTSLFNALTGLNQKVGNFPGVTVEKKTGHFQLSNQQKVELTDLPGTYSLYPRSKDERIAISQLVSETEKPDCIIVVLDASNLKRNLLFYTQLADLGIPIIIALNMLDNALDRGIEIDIDLISTRLNVPVIPINARNEKGIVELKAALENPKKRIPEKCLDYPSLSQGLLMGVKNKFQIEEDAKAFNYLLHPEENVFLKADEKEWILNHIQQSGNSLQTLQAKETIARYQYINEVLFDCIRLKNHVEAESFSNKLDKVLTHKIFGFAIFFLILFIVFQSIFTFAQIPMDAIDSSFSWLRSELKLFLPAGMLTDILCDGILAGLSGIIVFVPQIAILFLFIGILEDTGYLARVSFMTDRLMKKIGLNGKSIVPLMGGIACAVPAIMAARTIENKKDRLITILVTPLMSCSARLPVFTLLISLVVPNTKVAGFLSLQGLTLMALYLLGFVAAIASSIVFKWILKSKEQNYFMMELPVYRLPRWKNLSLELFNKVRSFVIDAGKIIILVSVILWFLASFSPTVSRQELELKHAGITNTTERNVVIQNEKLEMSYAGYLGKFIEPAIRPLGFDWKIGIALITSFSAREVFVGTMATIFSVDEADASTTKLKDKMMQAKNPKTGKLIFNFASSFSLMVFFALAMQCMSTLAVVKKETRTWKWPIIQMLFMTGLAYVSSLIVFWILK